ncbi:hypothetical protein SDC9_178405 [bioreactor metagenome]|uniref:Uncharacterized protein n=1 Tax=bioreactor metagenome TaxID=1076179 RepID=A0A645H3P1_9ZZZZ
MLAEGGPDDPFVDQCGNLVQQAVLGDHVGGLEQ